MHFNQQKSSPDLKFDVAAPRGWSYAAGDTIIGNLVRHNPVVTPDAEITLVLTGRIKSKVVKSNGNNGTSVFRDEYQLFNSRPQVLYRGPLHLPEGSDQTLDWPFEVNIPTEPAASMRQNHQQRASFLPLMQDHPAHHVLPGSFFCAPNLARGSQCKVEYALKATLRYKFGGDHVCKAVWPIDVRGPVSECPNRYEVKAIKAQNLVRSQRLLPGMKDAELSFGQGIKKFFGTSSVPELFYYVELTMPLVIQLGDSQPLPVSLLITPWREPTTDVIKDVPQEFKINWIKLAIRQCTEFRAPSRAWHSYRDHVEANSLDTGLVKLFTNMESPLTISTGKGNEPVHLGNTFQLTFSSRGLSSGTRLLTVGGKITPEFTTYCIKHTNFQEWQVSITVAGEIRVHKFQSPVKIIDGP
jgi:hypothetical protein